MDTTGQTAEILSAYAFRRRNVATSSSSEHTSVSPGTSVKAVKAQSAPKRRPPYISFSNSFSNSEGGSAQRIWIPSDWKLLEEVDSKHNQTASEDNKLSSSSNDGSSYLTKASAAVEHGLKNEISGSPKLSSLSSLRLTPKPLSLTSAIAPKERMKWTRSQSGSIWIRRHRAARETSSLDNSAPREPAGMIVMPLVPPVLPSRSELKVSQTSRVQVETPFPEVKEITRSTSQASNMSPADSLTQKIPVPPHKLLSAPIIALRRRVKMKQCASNVQLSHYQGTSTSPIEPQSHKSNLRRHQTAQMLDRVSSLLREGSKVPKIRRKFGKNGSDQTRSHQEGQCTGRAATFVSKNKSVEDSETTGTTTSSILKMQMGSTPLNSVLETATYRVKRCPSQDTEEFFAIDISIRGGTSYLPSEARRIHTPPLPDDDVINNIHKQGFFFDYWPSTSTKTSNSSSQQNNLHTAISKGKGRASQFAYGKSEAFSPTTSSLLLQDSSSKRTLLSQETSTPKKEKSRDDLDALVTDTEVSFSQPNSDPIPLEELRSEYHRTKIRAAREQQQQQYLDQLDWTIPEHLPSSPLCPRHPRY